MPEIQDKIGDLPPIHTSNETYHDQIQNNEDVETQSDAKDGTAYLQFDDKTQERLMKYYITNITQASRQGFFSDMFRLCMEMKQVRLRRGNKKKGGGEGGRS